MSSLVWTVNKDMAREMVEMDQEMFIAKLNKALFGKDDENSLVNSVSEGFGLFLNSFLPSSHKQEDSPPIVKGLDEVLWVSFLFQLRRSCEQGSFSSWFRAFQEVYWT